MHCVSQNTKYKNNCVEWAFFPFQRMYCCYAIHIHSIRFRSLRLICSTPPCKSFALVHIFRLGKWQWSIRISRRWPFENEFHVMIFVLQLTLVPYVFYRLNDKNLFFRNGTLNYKPNSGSNFGAHFKPLREYIKREKDEDTLLLIDLIRKTLKFNPKERINISKWLSCLLEII